ncbi:hypothetical protein GA0115240_123622 [Streptomyces sp. DvalAA-14]|uniref:hypothetical protein n=1 Tax=unclassified Streptomyces TaxID=2593676 RepID=UPI00081B3FD0|nr:MULTISPECIES: hypothetical protein [unclassified Streptomyces]MYS20815.1 hypothetical protein [Streptomyces sp. SID4948]SCD77853.1 hypothetical protein GA0115240_123622 [Streptomyces sp. DvalAA-14]
MAAYQPLGAVSATVATDAGMLVLWDPQRFKAVVDYDTWEDELLEDEDIVGHIEAGSLVPLNVGGDGAFGVLVRSGTAAAPATLTKRETAHQLGASQPYLFVSRGRALVGGIEYVSGAASSGVIERPVPEGRCAVVIHLIDWQAETGSQDETGRPVPGALPDFVVLINPAQPGHEAFRTAVNTFEAPNG